MPCGPIKPSGNQSLLDFHKNRKSELPPEQKRVTFVVRLQLLVQYYIILMHYKLYISRIIKMIDFVLSHVNYRCHAASLLQVSGDDLIWNFIMMLISEV